MAWTEDNLKKRPLSAFATKEETRLVTLKQLKFIWSLCKQMDLDAYKEVKQAFGYDELEMLSSQEASSLIGSLLKRKGEEPKPYTSYKPPSPKSIAAQKYLNKRFKEKIEEED